KSDRWNGAGWGPGPTRAAEPRRGPVMTRALCPFLEALEDRLTPTTFGYPWPDARHLTVSFVPDGTPVGASTSRLFSLLGPNQAAAWEQEMLRALQAWAATTNVDLNVVADDGSPLGTPGALQGDPRFGDIRIGAVPLSSGSVSTSVPFNPLAGTW